MKLSGVWSRLLLVGIMGLLSVSLCLGQPGAKDDPTGKDKAVEKDKEKSPEKEKDKETPKDGVPAPAFLIVKIVEDATLDVEGKRTKKIGEKRTFESPPLQPGKTYTYTLVAKWEPNNYTKITRTRKVKVEAGKTTEVDLTLHDDKQPDDIVIRYVPTPQKVVDAMLKMGKVGKDDVVYDIGCGDGRIVVTAVEKYNAKHGVGVDLDPERIRESKETAKRAGVTDKVEFRQQDAMRLTDLGKASVVTLYLGDDLNEQLRPLLKKQLKPGSRIVSHRFLMGDWKPEKTETIDVDGIDYKIHLWTIPGKAEKDD
jgi:uncharacterized protein (TIGR03000 family)